MKSDCGGVEHSFTGDLSFVSSSFFFFFFPRFSVMGSSPILDFNRMDLMHSAVLSGRLRVLFSDHEHNTFKCVCVYLTLVEEIRQVILGRKCESVSTRNP